MSHCRRPLQIGLQFCSLHVSLNSWSWGGLHWLHGQWRKEPWRNDLTTFSRSLGNPCLFVFWYGYHPLLEEDMGKWQRWTMDFLMIHGLSKGNHPLLWPKLNSGEWNLMIYPDFISGISLIHHISRTMENHHDHFVIISHSCTNWPCSMAIFNYRRVKKRDIAQSQICESWVWFWLPWFNRLVCFL